MPNQRAAGQKAVIVMMDQDFLREIEDALPKSGYGDRSNLIRQAVLKELSRLGYEVDATKAAAPSRAGKGGPKKKPKKQPLSLVAEEQPESYGKGMKITPPEEAKKPSKRKPHK